MSARPFDPDFEPKRYEAYLHMLARAQLRGRQHWNLSPSVLVQETLLRAHENRGQLRGGSNGEVMGWLRTILVNVLRSAFRHLSCRPDTDARSLDAAVEDSSRRLVQLLANGELTPSKHLEKDELLVRLADALEKLPEDKRRAVELRHLEGLSLEEIAQEMERTRASVAGLLRTGLKLMRQMMREND